MTRYKKILCAIDFSEHSKSVASHTRMLAEVMGGEVVVIFSASTT